MFRQSPLRRALLPVVGAVTLAVTAAGSLPASAQPGGSQPVKVMVIDQGDNASQPLVDVLASSKAAAKALTKAGQQIELDICKPPASTGPQDTEAVLPCVRQAIDNHDAAFVGTAGDDGMRLLADAKIPVVAPNALSPLEYNNPISFQPTGGAPVLFAAQGAAMVSQGAKKIALLDFDIDAAKPLAEFAKKAVIGSGGKVVDEINVPFQAVDVSSQVQQLKSSGADGALIITTEDIAAMLIRTMNQFGVKMKISAPAGGLRRETLDSLGSLADGLLAGSSVPWVSVGAKNPPSVAQYVKEMKAAKSFTADNTRTTGIIAWIAIHAIAEASKGLTGTVDGPALLDAFQTSQGLDLPIAGKWVPSATGPFPTYSRMSNGTGFYLKYTGDGKWKTLKPVAGADTFKLVQKAGGVG